MPGARETGDFAPLSWAESPMPLERGDRALVLPSRRRPSSSRPISIAMTKCSRPCTTFLSRRTASSTRRSDRSPTGGSGPSCAISSRQRLTLALGQRPARDRQVGGGQHAVGDRFAVPEAPVLRHRLERVADGVAVVEDAAQPAFALVLRDDVGLDPARLDDRRREHRRVAGEDRLGVARARRSNSVAARDHPVLDHLVQARAELAPRQRAQQQRIDERRAPADGTRRSGSCRACG